MTLITWTFLVLPPNITLILIQGSSASSNSWKKAGGTWKKAAVEMEEQIVKLEGRVVVSLSPVKEPKSLIKFWFCSGSLRPRPVSITWRAELFEKRRTRRKICFTSIAKSIDGANASKQKISELVWLWNYQWQPNMVLHWRTILQSSHSRSAMHYPIL